MEELKLLLTAVADMPEVAAYLAAFFLFLKFATVGAIAGAILKGVDLLVSGFKHAMDIQVRIKQEELASGERTHDMLAKGVVTESALAHMTVLQDTNSICIANCEQELWAQIGRIRRNNGNGVNYIHSGDVAWLKGIIDAQLGDRSDRGSY